LRLFGEKNVIVARPLDTDVHTLDIRICTYIQTHQHSRTSLYDPNAVLTQYGAYHNTLTPHQCSNWFDNK